MDKKQQLHSIYKKKTFYVPQNEIGCKHIIVYLFHVIVVY